MATTDTTLIDIKQYTKDLIPDVLQFERDLRSEEDFWGWEINERTGMTKIMPVPPKYAFYPTCFTIRMRSPAESLSPLIGFVFMMERTVV